MEAATDAPSRNPHECAVAKMDNGDELLGICVSQPARMRCGKDRVTWRGLQVPCRNPHECAVAKVKLNILCLAELCRNPHECAVAKRHGGEAVYAAFRSQPARMRCGKAVLTTTPSTRKSRNPHECAVAKSAASILVFRFTVATRTNALWQSFIFLPPAIGQPSQPARMRCGKDVGVISRTRTWASQPARMRCGKG